MTKRRKVKKNDLDTIAYYAFTSPRERERDRDRAMTWLPWLIGGAVVLFLITRSSSAVPTASTVDMTQYVAQPGV
jgi:hypothetical protein